MILCAMVITDPETVFIVTDSHQVHIHPYPRSAKQIDKWTLIADSSSSLNTNEEIKTQQPAT